MKRYFLVLLPIFPILAMVLGCGPKGGAGDGPPPDYTCGAVPATIDHSSDDKLSAQALKLLAVAEDGTLLCEPRADAVKDLGRLGERPAVDRLANLLPGNGDRLTYEVVNALGRIGGPKALAALERWQDHPSLSDAGKIHTAVDFAIADCKKNP